MFAVVVLGVAVFPRFAHARRDGRGGAFVKYSKEDIVPVRAKLRFSTLIVLPENEEILDFTTGDKEFWIINGAHNLCYVHPAQAGIRSNLNLITASGHVYSFLLTEISNEPNAEPDLKIFVEPKEGSSIAASTGLRGYVSAGEAEAYKKELETLRAQTADQVHAAQAQSAEQVNRFRSGYATKLQFDYPLDSKAAREPFLVSVIYHDDAFTYIKCAARGKARSLRNQGRQAEPDHFPVRERRVHRAQDHRRRLPRHRQKETAVCAARFRELRSRR